MKNRIIIIGAGFSGLSAACYLAREGFSVEVFEKHPIPGGRARNFKTSGFCFDMGPTWYWLPDVYERFFRHFDKSVSDFYSLSLLDPAYRMYFSREDYIDIPYGKERVIEKFESIEKGSGIKLRKFLEDAEFKYEAGIHKFVQKPAHSMTEFLEWDLIKALFRMDLLKSVSSVVKRTVRDQRLVYILEFPVIFLGATASHIPALYTMMNWADLGLGTWYPMGGMYKVVEAMFNLAVSLGVSFHFDSPVQKIITRSGKIAGVLAGGQEISANLVLASADYHHVEQTLLEEPGRRYTEHYWDKRKMAPSALLYYIEVNRKIDRYLHHNLLFDTDFYRHADEIYKDPQWPASPALYVSCSSKTDPEVAPDGMENLIVLIPVAPGMQDSEEIRGKYYNLMMERLENIAGHPIRDHVVYKRSYGYTDFVTDYNSFKGNAYGLANTLLQTGFLKPKLKSKNIQGLYYTGQLTTPGPGVPPAIISGQVAAREITKDMRV